jgi:hypothetical protein
MRMDS